MEILLRKYNDQYYVWKKAEFKQGGYYITEKSDEFCIPHHMIVAIKKDPNCSYVACKNCGAIIKNDTASIEAHYAAEEAKRDCLKCRYVRQNNKRIENISYVTNADGRHVVTENYLCDLVCRMSYQDYNIDSDAAKNRCVYNMCRKQGMKPVEDIFFAKPGLFDKFVTVDALIAKKLDNVEYYDGYFQYDLRSRGTLKACVNELGIVDHFILYYRYNSYNIYYSAKYNEMYFMDDSGRYTTRKPYSVSETKVEEVKKKIAALYEEANK